MQIVMSVDVDQRTELQAMIFDLEEENRYEIFYIQAFMGCEIHLLIFQALRSLEIDLVSENVVKF